MQERLRDYLVALEHLPSDYNGICFGMRLNDSGVLDAPVNDIRTVTLKIFVMSEFNGDSVMTSIGLGFDSMPVGRA